MKDSDLRQKGQSIVVVAAAMVALVLFVALAVDLSNTYYHRRTAQNAADGGALAGASQMALAINKLQNKDDKLIGRAINHFAELNGIEDTDPPAFDEDNTNVEAWYVNTSGDRLPGEPKVGDGKVPVKAVGVEVITHMVAPTYFGGIFGLHGLPVQARAVSLLRERCAEDCVVPITTHYSVLFTETITSTEPVPLIGECFNIFSQDTITDTTHSPGAWGWVNWTWQQSWCDGTATWTGDPPRTCPLWVDQKENGCDADTLPQNLDPANCGGVDIRVGDWMNSTTGIVNADDVRCWLLYYLGEYDSSCPTSPDEVPKPHPFIIPVYDDTNVPPGLNTGPSCLSMKDPEKPNSGGLHYHVAGFAVMQILGFDLSQGAGEEVNAGITGEPGDGDCLTLGEPPHSGNRITAEFLLWVDDKNLGEDCTDPMSTIYSAPKLFE